jgi:CFEM domain
MFVKGIAAAALLVASAQAIDTTGLPSCGVSGHRISLIGKGLTKLQAKCVTNSLNSQTACSTTDLSCLCGDQSFGYNVGYCLGSTCDGVDIQNSLTWFEKLCSSTSRKPAIYLIEPLLKTFGLGSSTPGAANPVTATTAALYTAVSGGETATATGSHPTATGSSSGSGSGSGSSSQTTTTTGQQSSGGLSTSAKVGIGLGVPLGVLAIAGGLLAAFFIGRKKKAIPTAGLENQPPTEPKGPTETVTAQLPAEPKYAPQPQAPGPEFYTPPPQKPTPAPQPAVPVQPAPNVQPEPPNPSVSPVSAYPHAPSPPPAYAQPYTQPFPPNAYEMPGNTAPQPQPYPIYEAPGVSYVPGSVPPPAGPPPPQNPIYEAPTGAPAVTGAAELPDR